MIALAVLVALPAEGAIAYHFTTTVRANGFQTSTSGRVVFAGDAYRIELPPDPSGQREYDVAVSQDGDRTAFLMNLKKKLVWPRRRAEGRIVSSRLFLLPGGFQTQLDGEAKVAYSKSAGGVIAGFAVTRHLIEIDYDIFGDFERTPIRGHVHAIAAIWCAPSLPRLPLQRDVTTGLAAIDKELAAIGAGIHGMPLRHELSVTRTMEGGPHVTETVVTSVETVERVVAADGVFGIPADMKEAQIATSD